jgi:radical SAM superfamily enzyme YgiQ (UPF0313 family)
MSLNLLLIYPLGEISHLRYPEDSPPLAIPQLCGYLKKRGITAYSLDMNLSNKWLCRLNNTLRSQFGWEYDYSRKTEHTSLQTLIKAALTDQPTMISKYVGKIQAQLQKHNIDVIGFSVLYPRQLYYTLLLAQQLKQKFPNIRLIAGGSLVTKYIQELIQTSVFDAFIIGDGELPLYQYLTHSPASEIPNLYYRDANGYVFSGKQFVADASYVVEPDFRGWYYRHRLYIKVGSGCPWGKCSFCTYPQANARYGGTAAPEYVVSIMQQLQKKYGIGYFRITDDSLSPKFLAKFSQELITQNTDIQWHCFLALFRSLKKTTIQAMADAGCRNVSIGLESMSERVLTLMDKPHKNPKWAIQVLEWLQEAGIEVAINVIFGFPSETRAEAMQTFEFVKMRRDLYQAIGVHSFTLERGTPAFNNPEQYGITSIEKGDLHDTGKNYRLGFSYQVDSGMSQKEAKEFAEMVKKTYL